MAEYADIWHSFTSADEFPAKSDVLDRHCADVGRDPATIERSAAVAVTLRAAPGRQCRSPGRPRRHAADRGCDGPDYDLTAAEALCTVAR